MRRIKIKQKEVIIPFCEGETEKMLFNFLKFIYSNKKLKFGTPQDLHGIRDFEDFKRKYLKHSKAYDLKPKKDFANVRFLLIIDNDLDDSKKIEGFILEEGHLVQLCDPNTEGMLLSIIGKKQIRDTIHEVFRKKCKDNFKNHFRCEAHQLKEVQLNVIFSNLHIVQDNLSVLYGLFTK
jgi:hypothetical protein